MTRKLKMSDKMTEAEKTWIDSSSYLELLRRWRFGKSGDEMFTGETGEYFKTTMFQKKAELSHEEQVGASKQLGWD